MGLSYLASKNINNGAESRRDRLEQPIESCSGSIGLVAAHTANLTSLSYHETSNSKITTSTTTMKFLKVGRVAIITRGRFAGKKVVTPDPSRQFESSIFNAQTIQILQLDREIMLTAIVSGRHYPAP